MPAKCNRYHIWWHVLIDRLGISACVRSTTFVYDKTGFNENDCPNYEGQHWTKITDSRSPSGCGEMRLPAIALTRIEAHRGAFRTHLGAYQFIETRLAETIRVDPGEFARI
jgi:hypothetical protein